MKSLIIFPLFMVSVLSQTDVDSKSVRLALETSFLFHPEDAHQDLGFVKNLKKFLGKIENVLAPTKKRFRAQTDSNKTVVQYFLKKLSKTLIKLNDADLKNVVQVFDAQMKSHDYPGSVWQTILTVPRLKAFSRDTIKQWSRTDPVILKEDLKSYINKSDNLLLNNIVSVLENYYTLHDRVALKKFTKKIIKRTEDMNSLIKKTLQSYLFERYETLNSTEKARIAYEMIKISENLQDTSATKKSRRGFEDNRIEEHLIIDKDLHVNVENINIIPHNKIETRPDITEKHETFLDQYNTGKKIDNDSKSD